MPEIEKKQAVKRGSTTITSGVGVEVAVGEGDTGVGVGAEMVQLDLVQ